MLSHRLALLAIAELSGPPISLDWRAPEGCPSDAAILERTRELLRGEPTSRAPIRASATVTQQAAFAWSLDLETMQDGAGGTRSLEARDCDSLAGATALILALMLRPEAAPVEPPEPRHEPRPSPAETVERTIESPAHAWGVDVGVLAEIVEGLLPRRSPSAAITFDLRFESLILRSALAYLPPQSIVLDSETGAGAELSAIRAAAGAGLTVAEIGPASIALFIDLEGGVVLGRAFGISDPKSGRGYWSSLIAGTSGRWLLGSSFALRFEAGAGLPIRRDHFSIDNLGEVHRPSDWSMRLSGGLEWRL
jgi:hypothetical protein